MQSSVFVGCMSNEKGYQCFGPVFDTKFIFMDIPFLIPSIFFKGWKALYSHDRENSKYVAVEESCYIPFC